jgi:V4R domain
VSSAPGATPQPRLRERLRHDGVRGAWHDGPRRYLVLRPDSLMGALYSLDAATRDTVFDALAQSLQRHGADSLRAYAASVSGAPQALIDATVDAACDLGWGEWSVRAEAGAMEVLVRHSPFAAGWAAAAGEVGPDAPAVCAPIRGMLAALAQSLGDPAPRVRELSCAAQGHALCRFHVAGVVP